MDIWTWILRSSIYIHYLAKLLKFTLLVLEITVSELNSSTDGVVANAPDAAAKVCKAGGEFRLRY
jgi:hypothetical protein